MSVDTRLWLEGRDLKVRSYQDCEDIIERNKRLQNEPQCGDFRQVYSIPLNILNMWLQEEIDRGNVSIKYTDEEFDKLVMRKLRDPDWKWLRAR